MITTNKHVWRLQSDIKDCNTSFGKKIKKKTRKEEKCVKRGFKNIKDINKYKSLARRTLKVLPKIKIKGVTLPKLLTRVDVASGLEGKNPHFVNEIEFVPSLYIQDHDHLIDKMLGDQMVKIMKIFKKNRVSKS